MTELQAFMLHQDSRHRLVAVALEQSRRNIALATERLQKRIAEHEKSDWHRGKTR